MKVIDAVASVLKAEGVQNLSCYPTTPLIDACTRVGIRPILCRQERVGVGIADGYARISELGFGVFGMQYGPGAENAFPGVASAFSDGVPVLFLPTGHPLDRRQLPPLFSAARAFSPVTKWGEVITRPSDVAEVMRRAFSAIRNGPPGPVVVEIPTDVAAAEIPGETLDYAPVSTFHYVADTGEIDRAVQTLLAARTPVILAGQGVLRAKAGPELRLLAEQLALPVMTTLEGKSAFPEDHPLSVGVASIVASDPVIEFMQGADLVLAVGASLTRHWTTPRLSASKVIHITVDPRDVNKSVPATHGLVGDAKLVLQGMLRALDDATRTSGRDARAMEDRIRDRRSAWLKEWRPKLESDEVPITPYRVIHDFMQVVKPDDAIVTHDSGSPRDQLLPFYASGIPNSYLSWGKSHALGGGLGLAMGAKLAAPEKVCVYFMGDAAFGMTGLDLETAARNHIPILAIVFNNSTMAIEVTSLVESHRAYGVRDIGGSYAEIAAALSVTSRRIRQPEEIIPSLQWGVDETRGGSPVLLEVITSAETTYANRGLLVDR